MKHQRRTGAFLKALEPCPEGGRAPHTIPILSNVLIEAGKKAG